MFLYGQDNLNRLPMATGFRDANGYSGLTPSSEVGRHPVAAGVSNYYEPTWMIYNSTTVATNVVYPIGTLARKGYIDSPKLLYCPSFERNVGLLSTAGFNATGISRFYVDQNVSFWRNITGGALDWNSFVQPGGGFTGLSYQLYVARSSSNSNSAPNPTFDDVADKWKSDTVWSPILHSCLQKGSGFWGSTQATLQSGLAQSHRGQGSNAAYFDGSARWVSLDEVRRQGWLADLGGGANNPYVYRDATPVAFLVNDQTPIEALNATTANFISWSRRITTFSSR